MPPLPGHHFLFCWFKQLCGFPDKSKISAAENVQLCSGPADVQTEVNRQHAVKVKTICVCVCVCVYIFEFALLVFLTCFVFSVFGQFCHFLTFWLSFKYIYIYICIYNIYSSEFFGLYLLIVYYLHHFISAFHFAFYVVLVIRPPWKGGQGHLM